MISAAFPESRPHTTQCARSLALWRWLRALSVGTVAVPTSDQLATIQEIARTPLRLDNSLEWPRALRSNSFPLSFYYTRYCLGETCRDMQSFSALPSQGTSLTWHVLVATRKPCWSLGFRNFVGASLGHWPWNWTSFAPPPHWSLEAWPSEWPCGIAK